MMWKALSAAAMLALLAAAPAKAADFTNFLGIKFVTLPAGQFYMGSCGENPANFGENKRRAFMGQAPIRDACPSGEAVDKDSSADRFPQHLVHIGYRFQVATTETTLGQFKNFLGTQQSLLTDKFMKDNAHGDLHPVTHVSWDDTQAFIRWLNANKPSDDAGTYRLLTEAEWEYAARAGTTTRYYWGDQVGKGNANCQSCGSQWDNRQTAPVGSFRPNAFGLYDMAGNVSEWVEDCYHENYQGAPSDGSAWRDAGSCRGMRAGRGGSWASFPNGLRSATRDPLSPGQRLSLFGFRLARTLP